MESMPEKGTSNIDHHRNSENQTSTPLVEAEVEGMGKMALSDAVKRNDLKEIRLFILISWIFMFGIGTVFGVWLVRQGFVPG
jgi:hypothetical protein